MTISIDVLHEVLEKVSSTQYVEARYHSRLRNEITIGNGAIEEAKSTRMVGVGFRVLVEGAWGFSSTNDTKLESMVNTLRDAINMAKISSTAKKKKNVKLAEIKLAKGVFKPLLRGPLEDYSLEEKVRLVKDTEHITRKNFDLVKTATCSYREIIDHKLIVNSDGAQAEIFDSKPEFRVMAIASRNGDRVSAVEMAGVTGGWKDLFKKASAEDMALKAAETSSKLLSAKHPKGERSKVILDPGMVGLISHEAIGHTVEADFVLSGSIVNGKLGEKIASDNVTLIDSGNSEIVEGAAGTVFVDDEGVLTTRTIIINDGFLDSYIHNRETAGEFGVSPTGNARAFEYSDEPIIRMRNTYIQPCDYDLDEMIKETRHGYLLQGPRSGQADANGEFMFGAQEAYLIINGEVKDLFRGVTISGRALDVLKTIDAVGKDFQYDLGTGYCGKRQLAKVDGGGPHLRCDALIGGLQ
jgi:TldD protein